MVQNNPPCQRVKRTKRDLRFNLEEAPGSELASIPIRKKALRRSDLADAVAQVRDGYFFAGRYEGMVA